MRQAITTRYLGPTNSRGSRIKAVARRADRVNNLPELGHTVPRNYALNVDENSCRAAQALAEKLEWPGLWVGGGNVDEDGYVFVNIPHPVSWGLMASSGSLGAEGRDWFFLPGREG